MAAKYRIQCELKVNGKNRTLARLASFDWISKGDDAHAALVNFNRKPVAWYRISSFHAFVLLQRDARRPGRDAPHPCRQTAPYLALLCLTYRVSLSTM